jgi:hypothetical protein
MEEVGFDCSPHWKQNAPSHIVALIGLQAILCRDDDPSWLGCLNSSVGSPVNFNLYPQKRFHIISDCIPNFVWHCVK